MQNKQTTREMVTPPELAKRWGVKPDKVLTWIRSGELRAIDVSVKHGVGRPRFRIAEADILAFEQRRAFQAAPKPPSRRRKSDPNVIEFF